MILTGGPRDAADRHRTLRQTIEWSYDLLDVSEQSLFRSLSVFVDGCRLDAAESVCLTSGDLSVVDGLQSLVDKSLVRQRSEHRKRKSRSPAEARQLVVVALNVLTDERMDHPVALAAKKIGRD